MKKLLLSCLMLWSFTAFAAREDDDLLLENPTFGKNQWVFVFADQFSVRFSFEKSTMVTEGRTITVWTREDPLTLAERLHQKETVVSLWKLDCSGKKGNILQRWTVDGSNYAWKSHKVDPQATVLLSPKSIQWHMCFGR